MFSILPSLLPILQTVVALALNDQERTEVKADPIRCEARSADHSLCLDLPCAVARRALGSMNNILNQEAWLCVFLLGQPSRSSAV